MPKIKLSKGFVTIPEGTHIFKIVSINYDETFGKIKVNMQTQDGSKHTERFALMKSSGQPNEGAWNAFSYFAKKALQNDNLEEIDPYDLVGHFLECDVKHDVVENVKKPGETITFARLSEKRSSNGWEETSNPAPAKTIDLSAIFG